MIHNQLQYHGDLGRGLARIVGMDENEDGLIRLGETLQTVIDPWRQPEHYFPRREIIWSAFSQVAPVVAEFGMAAIINETDNGLVIIDVITASDATVGSAMAAGFASEASLVATLGPSGILSVDRRQGFAAVRTRLFQGTDPTFPFSTRQEQISEDAANAARTFQTIVPAILAPHTGLWVECSTANLQFNVNFRGRERMANPGELRGS